MTATLDIPIHAPSTCYHGGSFFEAIGDEFDALERRRSVINADVLDAWFDPSPKVTEALTEHLPWLLRTSPPTGCEGLIRTIARVRGVAPACVLPGAGSSDLMFLVLREWLTPASRVLILDPTYGEYAHVLENVVQCRVERFELSRANGYEVDPAAFERCLTRGFDLVIVVNPNSPTGRTVPREILQEILTRNQHKTRFWIDETYVEYAGRGASLERFAATSENVVVCKSMSKVYALSGARAAYLCGPPDLIDPLRVLTPPWAVSLPAQVAAVAALRDPAYYALRYEQTHALRKRLVRDLRAIGGIETIPSVANFVLCHLSHDLPDAATVVDACRRFGLFIRDVSTMGAQLGNRAVRIAVKDAETNRRMVEVLSRVLRSNPGTGPRRDGGTIHERADCGRSDGRCSTLTQKSLP